MQKLAGLISLILLTLVLFPSSSFGESVFLEAEGFDKHGGWSLDTQSITAMGSPYLLAHGLGKPVEDATTKIAFPKTGTYRIWIHTKDWVARWKAPGHPGRFQILLNGQALKETFGTKGADWFWHDGGTVEISQKENELKLHDLTGFEGRCDAIFLTTDLNFTPPNKKEELHSWRLKMLGVTEKPIQKGPYDLVVIGGGYAGMASALSASRMGCKVALIQNRPVLGGNGSSEIQVWAMGLIRRGKFSRVGEIVDEFADHAKASPGTIEEFGDDIKEKIIRAENKIDLYLNHHAEAVTTNGKKIVSVQSFNTKTNQRYVFTGNLFVDCTGHGTIGYLAKADWEMTPKGRMGMSNMWRWAEAETPQSFPETPWALNLNMSQFPYPKRHHAQWFWESGFDKDPIKDAEGIRDWNFRAAYGAFNAMKNKEGAKEHKNAKLLWMAFIGGPRESRRLMGDVILTEDHIVKKKQFPDGCVPSTWSIDLHYPKKSYEKDFKENPFISVAVHGQGVDRQFGYPVPYRCFYSRNIKNLFMAGRCISVTHEALGTVRVMKTCGMMGEVVGKAAAICTLHNCLPKDINDRYLEDLFVLLKLPGKARRETLGGPTKIPADALADAGAAGPVPGIDPAKLDGLVIDDLKSKITGKWVKGRGNRPYVAYGYLYTSGGKDATVTFSFTPKVTGLHEVRLCYNPHENRSPNANIEVHSIDGIKMIKINMKKNKSENGFISLGQFLFKKGQKAKVVINAKNSTGNVVADAIQVLAPQ